MELTYRDGGSGIVSFISNYSWLDGLSFTAMRERYLEAYDRSGSTASTATSTRPASTTPDGKPDPVVFSTEHNREGIQVGTAIATHDPQTRAHARTTTIAIPASLGHCEAPGVT